jgi:hypothetical protein
VEGTSSLDIVDDLLDLAARLENGPYVRLKTQRDALKAAAEEIARLREAREWDQFFFERGEYS